MAAGEVEVRPWAAGDAEALGGAIQASLEHSRPWMAWAADEPMALAARRALLER